MTNLRIKWGRKNWERRGRLYSVSLTNKWRKRRASRAEKTHHSTRVTHAYNGWPSKTCEKTQPEPSHPASKLRPPCSLLSPQFPTSSPRTKKWSKSKVSRALSQPRSCCSQRLPVCWALALSKSNKISKGTYRIYLAIPPVPVKIKTVQVGTRMMMRKKKIVLRSVIYSLSLRPLSSA